MKQIARAPVALALLLLVGLLVPAAPVSASAAVAKAPTLKRAARNLGTVSLHGRTAERKDRVVLQRRTRKRKWVRVRRLTSHNHRFRTVVWKKRRRIAYRVVDASSGRRSRVRRVPRLKVTRDACGVRPLKPSGEPWRCSLHDDFDGSEVSDRRWTTQVYGMSSGRDGVWVCYRDANVSLSSGSLQLVARPAAPEECPVPEGEWQVYTAGMVSTHGLWSQRYGRFQARVRNTATTVPGLHEAFWMWPREQGEKDIDEIDVSETFSGQSWLSVPFLHYGRNRSRTTGPDQTTAHDCLAGRGQWNTYRMVWTAHRIRIFVNGRECLTNTSGNEAFRKRYILMFTQTLGFNSGNRFDPGDPPPLPAVLEVDYARVWH